MRRTVVLVLAAAAVLVLPSLAGAEEPSTTTVVPDTTVVADTTVVPPTTAAPAEAPSGETTLAVGDETAYRAALTALSVDVTGPHTIDLTADVTVDDGLDPTYVGTQPLTIDGHGFTLDGVGTSRLLVMDSGNDSALTLTAITVANGDTAGDGGGILVLNDSPVTVADARFDGNTAQGSGGAIEAAETAVVERSTFSGNQATSGDGGAIDATASAGAFAITDSSFTGNQAPAGQGGALGPASDPGDIDEITVQRTTFAGNHAREGGAIVLTDGMAVVNSTIASNSASVAGGGVFATGLGVMGGHYSTIAGNRAPDGANIAQDGRGSVVLLASVVVEPLGGGDNCRSSTAVNGQLSHTDDPSCHFGNDGPAMLGPLQDNGGPTLTRAPLPGSPLIDAIPKSTFTGPGGFGDDCGLTAIVGDVDQRGLPRPVEGDGVQDVNAGIVPNPPPLPPGCDIGSVEVAFVAAPPTPSGPVAGSPGFTG